MMKQRFKIALLAALLTFSAGRLFAADRDSLYNIIRQAISRKITERRSENEQRRRQGLPANYLIYVGEKDIEEEKDFPANVVSLRQKNTQEADVEKIWDFTGNPTLQTLPQQLQKFSQDQGYDYYIVVCAIYNYFTLDEETNFNNITWDSVGNLASKKTAASTEQSGAASTTKSPVKKLSGGYKNLFSYLVNKFKNDGTISKSARAAVYHFVITTYVPYQHVEDNRVAGRLRHFQGLYWTSPNNNPSYDAVLVNYYRSNQAELAGSGLYGATKPSSKEEWLSAFVSSNQQIIAGILSFKEQDLMACTDADSLTTKLSAIPAQVLAGLSKDLRIHVLQVLSGNYIHNDREALVCSLIEQAPADQADDIITAMRNPDPFVPAQVYSVALGGDPISGASAPPVLVDNPKKGWCLLQCITEETNDKTLGIWGGDNYHRLIKALTGLCYNSNAFLAQAKQLNDNYQSSTADKIPDRLILYSYNSFWSKVGSTFAYSNFAFIPRIDWNTSYLDNCQLSLQREIFFSYLAPNSPAGSLILDPFEPIIFENNSDLGMLTDLSGTMGSDHIVPSIIMKYADEKGSDETITDATMAAIDVASLATGYGELKLGITGVRKAWVLFDMVNSGINLTVNATAYDNPKIKQALGIYNIITGGISAPRTIGDIYKGVKSLAGVLSPDNIKSFIQSVKDAGSDMGKLGSQDAGAVEKMLTRIKAEADARIQAGAATQDLTDLDQSAGEALAVIRGARLSWIDNLVEGWDDGLRTALKTDITANTTLSTAFMTASDASRIELANSWKLLQQAGRTGLKLKPEALTALAAAVKNGKLQGMGFTAELLANVKASTLDEGDFATIIGNLDNFGKKLAQDAYKDIRFNNFENIINKLTDNNTQNSQAAQWIIQDITQNTDDFKGYTWTMESQVKNSGGNTAYIDLKSDGQSPISIEYKWLTSGPLDKTSFISQFIQRDLYNATDLTKLQWRIKGVKLTMATAVEYLTSVEGEAALEALNLAQVQKMLNNEFISEGGKAQAIIDYLSVQENFNAIFK